MDVMLPREFDANEWYILISLCTAISITLALPRRFPTAITLVILSLGVGFPMFFDFLLAPPPFDLYHINDTSKYELFEIILYYVCPLFAYLFLYYYDKWNVRGIFVTVYILAWSTFGMLFEALAVICHVFKYNGWNMGYSVVFYLAAQSFFIWLYSVIKKNYNQTKRETNPEWD